MIRSCFFFFFNSMCSSLEKFFNLKIYNECKEWQIVHHGSYFSAVLSFSSEPFAFFFSPHSQADASAVMTRLATKYQKNREAKEKISYYSTNDRFKHIHTRVYVYKKKKMGQIHSAQYQLSKESSSFRFVGEN